MEYLYSLTVALFLTIALIPLMIRVSASLGLVDDPSAERKVHTTSMPRTGGLGIIIGAALPITFLLPFDGYLVNLFLGSVIIVFFGLLDDRMELGYKYKLFGQSLAAVVVMSGGVVIAEFPFFGFEQAPVWVTYPVTFFFLIGVVNGVNFSDGLDGLAAGTSIMALLLIFLLAIQSENMEVALIALTIVGGVLGFLRYNTFPANIFMGDAGSQFLGFIIACLAICVTQADQSPFSTLLPVLILGIPIMDILQVVPVRVHKKLPLPGPDKEHFHHQLVKLGFRHIEVVGIIYVLQTALMAGAFWLRYETDLVVALFYAGFVSLILSSILLANIGNWQFHADVNSQEQGERRNSFLRRFDWYFQHSARLLAVFLGGFYLLLAAYFYQGLIGWVAAILVLLFTLAAGLFLSKSANAPFIFRFVLYVVCVLFAYEIVASDLTQSVQYLINAYLFAILLALVLAIRMTRKKEFSLTTQDLLILIVVLLIPLLPFEALDQYAVGQMALIVAVLMYASEYVLNRATRLVALSSACAIAATSILFFVGS
jgi:UDP-GlcNAc:undecaprenyl-phosphate/decaprenyl-phosphate GlcNAc-1-phosphate transferase